MKEIKAYIQRWKVDAVVSVLEEGGAPGISIVEIHPVGYGYQPNYFDPAFDADDVFALYSHLSVVKVEVVCRDEDSRRLVQLIQDAASTGSQGDGRIFVSDVVEAVRIRDGARGSEAL